MTRMSKEEFEQHIAECPTLSAMFERALIAAEINLDCDETRELAKLDPEAPQKIRRSTILAMAYIQASTTTGKMFRDIVMDVFNTPCLLIKQPN